MDGFLIVALMSRMRGVNTHALDVPMICDGLHRLSPDEITKWQRSLFCRAFCNTRS
ncbi:hypothetical protein PISMIDRAFT_497912 [Pisolithus microcarpus 441]|uniref:Uncharacterized protein n=1 Tax=Pisolithus microcarpus 441 TaxID=765257 RepID=A0A0C9ZS09_9AGAM|nr:hypothetical protein PISMIDRAFT_497912 [Pisolithus microcarpus 441]